VIVNTAVVDTDVANGAIDVIPGTHRRYYEFWRFALERWRRESLRIPMRQGDVLVRTSNLCTGACRTAPRRPTHGRLHLGGRRHHAPGPLCDPRRKIRFFPNWYRPTRLGRLRERIYVAAPITYDATGSSDRSS